MSAILTCPLCGQQAVEEVGESGEFWDHCNACRTDDPFLKAARKGIEDEGSFNLGLLKGLTGERFERTLAALMAEYGDMRVHYAEPPKADPF